MKLNILKRIRLVVSILSLLAISLIFIDIQYLIDSNIINKIIYIQFLPSLLKFLVYPSLIASGFIFIIILTFFYGRVYCSFFCPLGILQDIILRISNLFNKKKINEYSKPQNILKYSLLALIVISFLTGSVFLINIFDPFSIYGKIMNVLIRPIIIGINNIISDNIQTTEFNYIYFIDNQWFELEILLLPIVLLLVIGYITIKHGRLWCNTICPVGGLLSIISKFSLYKLQINNHTCISCGLCQKVCKANCIDNSSKTIDFTRCVNCYNCIDVCRIDGITYKNSYIKKKTEEIVNLKIDKNKREIITGSLGFLMAMSGLQSCKNTQENFQGQKYDGKARMPITPPGSESIENFTNRCTACNLCVANCPSKVLQPSFLDYGVLGILQPKMDYNTGFCNLKCTKCGEVCPTGAIKAVTEADKQKIQIGRVSLIFDYCIVFTDGTDCGACSEHCPSKAVYMEAYGHLFAPQINPEICIGCGACEYICPSKPIKAITVKSNPIHKIAKKPENKRINNNKNDDFPF